ncbi:hypothetical protein C3433_23260 [Citrobacter freundii]|nr:hypothetical protein C3433_23260 [Citrobacter freundii]
MKKACVGTTLCIVISSHVPNASGNCELIRVPGSQSTTRFDPQYSYSPAHSNVTADGSALNMTFRLDSGSRQMNISAGGYKTPQRTITPQLVPYTGQVFRTIAEWVGMDGEGFSGDVFRGSLTCMENGICMGTMWDPNTYSRKVNRFKSGGSPTLYNSDESVSSITWPSASECSTLLSANGGASLDYTMTLMIKPLLRKANSNELIWQTNSWESVTTTGKLMLKRTLSASVYPQQLSFGTTTATTTSALNVDVTVTSQPGSRFSVTYAYSASSGVAHNVSVNRFYLPYTYNSSVPNGQSSTRVSLPVRVESSSKGAVSGRLQVTVQLI